MTFRYTLALIALAFFFATSLYVAERVYEAEMLFGDELPVRQEVRP
jgi:hypothetical protein